MNVHGIEFPDGKYYSCTDPENLTHESPEEALVEVLDCDLDPRMTVAETVKCITARPVTVTAYDPVEMGEKWMAREAERLLEQLEEDWQEEFGDPDGDRDAAMPSGAQDLMAGAVKVLLANAIPWACVSTGKVTLSGEQVEAIMREYKPEWFAASAPTPAAAPESGGEDKSHE